MVLCVRSAAPTLIAESQMGSSEAYSKLAAKWAGDSRVVALGQGLGDV
jgi:hypothetical protein